MCGVEGMWIVEIVDLPSDGWMLSLWWRGMTWESSRTCLETTKAQGTALPGSFLVQWVNQKFDLLMCSFDMVLWQILAVKHVFLEAKWFWPRLTSHVWWFSLSFRWGQSHSSHRPCLRERSLVEFSAVKVPECVGLLGIGSTRLSSWHGRLISRCINEILRRWWEVPSNR